jgi:hypothetical protein
MASSSAIAAAVKSGASPLSSIALRAISWSVARGLFLLLFAMGMRLRMIARRRAVNLALRPSALLKIASA